MINRRLFRSEENTYFTSLTHWYCDRSNPTPILTNFLIGHFLESYNGPDTTHKSLLIDDNEDDIDKVWCNMNQYRRSTCNFSEPFRMVGDYERRLMVPKTKSTKLCLMFFEIQGVSESYYETCIINLICISHLFHYTYKRLSVSPRVCESLEIDFKPSINK